MANKVYTKIDDERVYFISESDLKNNTTINQNVEQSLLNSSILDAQLLHIQMILGSKLYKKIESLISLGTITNPTNSYYKLLLDDYIRPATIQWTLAECVPYIRYKIMNKSISGQSSDNSTPIELEELKYLQAQFINKAEFYTQRIADYLLSNLNHFPEYTQATAIDDIIPSTNAYFSGIQLDEGTQDLRRSLGLQGLNSYDI